MSVIFASLPRNPEPKTQNSERLPTSCSTRCPLAAREGSHMTLIVEGPHSLLAWSLGLWDGG